MRNKTNQRSIIWSLLLSGEANLRPRWQNFTQTFLYSIPRVFFYLRLVRLWTEARCPVVPSRINSFVLA